MILFDWFYCIFVIKTIQLKVLKLSWFWFYSWNLIGIFNVFKLWFNFVFRGLSTMKTMAFWKKSSKTYHYFDFLDINWSALKLKSITLCTLLCSKNGAEVDWHYWATPDFSIKRSVKCAVWKCGCALTDFIVIHTGAAWQAMTSWLTFSVQRAQSSHHVAAGKWKFSWLKSVFLIQSVKSVSCIF